MSRPAISWADWARAMRVLAVGDAGAARRIAALLGLDPAEPKAAGDGGGELDGGTDRPPPLPRFSPPEPRADDPGSRPAPLPQAEPLPDAPPERLELQPLFDTPPVPRPPRAFQPLSVLLDHVPTPTRALDPDLSLFPSRRQRALLATCVSASIAAGELDIEAIVDRVARGLPMSSWPRRPVRSTRRGVQLLLDAGGGMLPFRRDTARLHHAVLELLDADLVDVRLFFDVPGPVIDRTGRRTPHQPPPPGTPILVASTVGIGREEPSTIERWRAFAAACRKNGNPLTVLVPYPRHRWPTTLGRLRCVPWDRGTSLSTLLRAGVAR